LWCQESKMNADGEIGTYYLNDKWISTKNDVTVSIFDITVLRGFGIFEFLRTYNRQPFLMRPHMQRLFNSAKEVGIIISKSLEDIEALVHEGIAKTTFDDLYIKIIVTGGVTSDAISVGESSLICLFLEATTIPSWKKTNGVQLLTTTFERYLPRVKSLDYMAAVVTLTKARQTGAEDVIYLSNQGNILEGTTYNVFAVMNGKIYTSEQSILYGCTRKFILELCDKAGIEVVLGELPISKLRDFEEFFASSTTKEIMPVVKVDDHVIGDGTPGPLTKKMMDLFVAANKREYVGQT